MVLWMFFSPMNCIILVGGLGTRLRPLTYTTPKALLEIQGKPILQYTLEALPDEINTVVIAVKHLGQKIKARFGKKFGAKKVIYVDLISLRGTMDALKQCKKWVKGQTLVLNGDDIYGREDLARLVKALKKEPKSWFVLAKEGKAASAFGQVTVTAEEIVENIIESPNLGSLTSKVNTGAYILDERIFHYKPVRIPNGEFGLPQTMMQAKKEIPLRAVRASFWMPLNTLEDYKHIQSVFSR